MGHGGCMKFIHGPGFREHEEKRKTLHNIGDGLQAAGKHVGRPKMMKSVADAAQAICEQVLAATGKLPTCRALAKELNMSIGTAHALRGKLKNQPGEKTGIS